MHAASWPEYLCACFFVFTCMTFNSQHVDTTLLYFTRRTEVLHYDAFQFSNPISNWLPIFLIDFQMNFDPNWGPIMISSCKFWKQLEVRTKPLQQNLFGLYVIIHCLLVHGIGYLLGFGTSNV